MKREEKNNGPSCFSVDCLSLFFNGDGLFLCRIWRRVDLSGFFGSFWIFLSFDSENRPDLQSDRCIGRGLSLYSGQTIFFPARFTFYCLFYSLCLPRWKSF